MSSILKFFGLGILCVGISPVVMAEEPDRRIPNEYETVGGHSLGLGNVGAAAQSGLAAVRLNPALLSLEKAYAVAGGYNWPTQGRDFFQAGVVDSESAKIAAGVNFTGFGDKYGSELSELEKDSPVERRVSVGLAQSMGLAAAGLSVQYLEAHSYEGALEDEEIKGTSLGFGIAGLLTPKLRFGLSAENLANKKISDYAPRTFRAGVALLAFNGDFTVHLDLRQRDRVQQLEQDQAIKGGFMKTNDEEKNPDRGYNLAEIKKDDKEYESPERMAFASCSARIYDMLRLLGAYGQSIDGPERKTLSGGVAVVSGNFSLSYSASRPYMKDPESHQAINAAFNVSL